MDVLDEKGLLPLAVLVRSEYLEMPGLRLTSAQAVRLLGLEPAVCARLFSHLVSSGFLRIGRDGHYVRADAA